MYNYKVFSRYNISINEIKSLKTENRASFFSVVNIVFNIRLYDY